MAVRSLDLAPPTLRLVPPAAPDRRRPLAAAVLVAAVVIGLLAGSAGGGGVSHADRAGPKAVRVHPGQTLWDVASRHAPEGSDPRAYVDALIELNGLDGGVILPGTRLRLP